MSLEERIIEKPSFKEVGKEISNSCVLPGYNFYMLNRNIYFNKSSSTTKYLTNAILVTTETLFYYSMLELTQGNTEVYSLFPLAIGFLGKVNGVQIGLMDNYLKDNN